MKLFLFALLFIHNIQAFNIVSINLIIKRNIENSLISFIKLPNVNNVKVKNTDNYLILKFLDNDNKLQINPVLIKSIDDKVINFVSNDIYETVKNNKKPLMIISKNKDSKYLYLIKSKNEYVMKYTFDYNNKRHKYYFDVLAKSIDKYETLWEVSALIKDYSPYKTLEMIGFYIKNWIEHNIYNNTNNNLYKKYIILYYFLNL